MKVMILANAGGGLYQFRNELLEALLPEHEVVLSVPDSRYTSRFQQLGCRVIPTSFDRRGKNPLDNLRLLKKYKEMLTREQPDMVFTYTIKPNIYGGMVCAMLKIPYLTNITGLGTALENGGAMQKVALLLYKQALKKAQKVFFQNESDQNFMLRHGVVRGAYELLPGSGVNLEKFSVKEYPRGETVDFFFFARVMREKGIEQYLEAAEAIRGKYPQTVFHICGRCEPSYEKRLSELQSRKVIIYHGVIDNVAEMHEISACTLHPTFYPEGMSNVLLESCACARPIITTNRPGCGEIVEDGVNGFVVREKDSRDLICQIEKFLSLPWEERRQMGLNGRAKVEKKFDRRIVVEKYLKELNRRNCHEL